MWAEAPAIPQEDVAIHHRFERQVELSPDAVALVCGDESFTYRESKPVSPIRWPIDCSSSAWGRRPSWASTSTDGRRRVVGLLGVLKAGGAYLPLDTDHPAERLAAMLRGFRGERAGDRRPSARPAAGMPAAWSSPSIPR